MDPLPPAPITSETPARADEAQRSVAELVSVVYDEAPATLRTKLLECLLGPVGPLAIVAIAAGAFSHLLYRLQGRAIPVTLEDAARVSSYHVLELVRYVEQCSPHALLRLGSLIADSPFGQATVSGSALLLALRMLTDGKSRHVP